MRVASLGVARPAYYDRNATAINQVYDAASVAPHLSTVRVTYTVASGKKALVESQSLFVGRYTAATVVAYLSATIYIDSGAGSASQGRVLNNSNTVYSSQSLLSMGNMTLYAGEIYKIETQDGSTGGTGWYTLGMKGTLFDA